MATAPRPPSTTIRASCSSPSIQDELYPPGWGSEGQVGKKGQGEGFTVNIPMPAGTGNAGYREAFRRVIIPVATAFKPELIIISAGQDAEPDGSPRPHVPDNPGLPRNDPDHARRR